MLTRLVARLGRVSGRVLSRASGGLQGRLKGRRAAAQALDTQAFLQVARQSFLQMQAAWDRADLPAMGQMASEALLQELREQLAERGASNNRTEVLELHAKLLALEELHEAYIASIEFSGLIREAIDTRAEPFRELWMLAKIKPAGAGTAAAQPGRGWQLARVQSLS